MKKENELRELKVLYTSSQSQAYDLILKTYYKNAICCQEQFNMLFINNAFQTLGIYKASKGGISWNYSRYKVNFSNGIKIISNRSYIITQSSIRKSKVFLC